MLTERFNDTVYSVTSKGIKPRYLVNYQGEQEKQSEVLNDLSIENKFQEIRKKRLSNIISFYENERYIFLVYNVFDPKLKFDYINEMLYNKYTHKAIVFQNGFSKMSARLEDFVFKYNVMDAALTKILRNGRFVTVMQPVYLLEKLRWEKHEHIVNGPMQKFFTRFKLNDI